MIIHFSFDFDRRIWKNMRRAIRALGPDSLFYRFLKASFNVLQTRLDRANWLFNQLWLETSDSYGVTLFGQRYKVASIPGESLESYRNRITLERSSSTRSTNKGRKALLQAVLGIDPDTVKIVRPRNFAFGPGAQVGSLMMSHEYASYAYRLYAPAPATPDAEKEKFALRLIESGNLGGNYPELWLDEGPGTYDKPCYESGGSGRHNYRIF